MHETRLAHGGMSATMRPRIMSGFVFKSVFGESPDLTKTLLELSLGTRIRSIEIVQSEKELDVLPGSRAGRVDVFAIDEDGNRYDAEVQAERRGNEVLRARHYQSLVDATQLKRGAEVSGLRKNIVLFVCDFDPLGAGLRLYDCRTVCLQTSRPVDDGRRLIMLNARGKSGDVPESLAAFLRLCAGEAVEGDAFVDRVNAMIDECVTDPKWMEGYMTFEDELEAARYNAEKRGERRGEKRGEKRKALQIAVRLVKDGLADERGAAELTGADPDALARELATADESADGGIHDLRG